MPNRVARRSRSPRWLLATALAASALPLHAVELRLLSAGAVEPGIRPVLAAFERSSGHTVRLDFATAPELRAALRTPTGGDVVIAPPAVLDEVGAGTLPVSASSATASSATAATTSSATRPAAPPPSATAPWATAPTATTRPAASARAPIGRVGVGIAIRAGADAPDISSAETLQAALASATSVVFNRASTGVYVESMLSRLGIADAVNAKAVRFADGASVMRHLVAGSAPREFGFGAMTEIVLFAPQGVELVGPLPAALQNYTSYFAARWPGAPPAEPMRADAVAALMEYLQGGQARALFAAAGIEPTP